MSAAEQSPAEQSPSEQSPAEPSPAEQFATVVVIGAGQAGLSAGHHLQGRGFAPAIPDDSHDTAVLRVDSALRTKAGTAPTFVMFDANPAPGGAWQHRWDSLTMDTVNGIFDLPDFERTPGDPHEKSSIAVPEYFAQYEARSHFPLLRPVTVTEVRPAGPDPQADLLVTTSAGVWRTRTVINATGTWDNPIRPHYPGQETFLGRQLHTRDYVAKEEFAGQTVAVVGAGISALQHLGEISQVARTLWYTRRPPEFSDKEFLPETEGRRTIAAVTADVEAGNPTGSVVSYTKLPRLSYLEETFKTGVLDRRPMFTGIEPRGLREADGTFTSADVILWATGFKPSIAHLDPLKLRNERGGIQLDGTQVVKDPRIQLVGFGPSQSTVGANRAGREAVRRIRRYLKESALTQS